MLKNNQIYIQWFLLMKTANCHKKAMRPFAALCLFLCGMLFFVLLASGCNSIETKTENDYVIRVGDSIITPLDFKEALVIAKVAYPHNLLKDAEHLKIVKLRLINELTEEIILEKRAKELQIEVSDVELEREIIKYRADYPEGMFEEILLSQAISYDYWKNSIRKKIMIEKVLARELYENINISQDDISRYYRILTKKAGLQKVGGTNDESTDKIGDPQISVESIILSLRKKKAEMLYNDWMKALKQKYPIEINEELLEEIMKS